MALSPCHATCQEPQDARAGLTFSAHAGELMGLLPLRTTKHCIGMDLGCLLISFLKIVVFPFVRMTTLCQLLTEAFPTKCCFQCHCSMVPPLLWGLFWFWLFPFTTLTCRICIYAFSYFLPSPLNICSGFFFLLLLSILFSSMLSYLHALIFIPPCFSYPG